MTTESTNLSILSKSDERASIDESTVVPNVSVDNLVFCVDESQLKVLLVRYPDEDKSNRWGLIGHWVRMDEDLTDAAYRVVQDVTQVENLYLEQVKTFGAVNRYPYKRILTVAYCSLLRISEVVLTPKNTNLELAWFNVYELPELIFDHAEIVQDVIEHLRYKIRREPIGFNLLNQNFTLLELQTIYEAILNTELVKQNFRRKILAMDLLRECGEKQTNVSHRAAKLYKFDQEAYQKAKQFGFNFQF